MHHHEGKQVIYSKAIKLVESMCKVVYKIIGGSIPDISSEVW